MRRFKISSAKFTGEGELWYNFDGYLCRIDLYDCSMSYEQIAYLLKYISPTEAQLKELFASSTLQIKEVPFELNLSDFKRDYPYSRNFHLLDARWAKMPRKDQITACFKAIDYRKYCERNSWYKPMIADTWLSKKEYLNNWSKI